jgi:uncharacterized integral membrane protein
MRVKLLLILLLFLIFAIIAAQNTIPTDFKFLFWNTQSPLIVMIVVIFILGLIIGLVFCSFYERKKRKQENEIQRKSNEKNKLSGEEPMK